MPVEEIGNRAVPVARGRTNKYGIINDEFKLKNGRKPRTWNDEMKIASWIHIDEIWTLLELHHDDVHFSRWRRMGNKAPL